MDSKHGYLYISESFDPVINLGIESYLTEEVGENEYILFLWQNKNTVVIGRNQNPHLECNIDRVRENGGNIARRPSGGGAVYHDMGNLNFSFITREDEYDLDTNLEIIKGALKSFDIKCEFSGRNDLTISGLKFSGNAFYQIGDGYCHHGTLLVDVDISDMVRYLTPNESKLASKAISSVRSRVINLSTLKKNLDIDTLKSALEISLRSRIGYLDVDRVDELSYDIDKYVNKYSTNEWVLFDCPVYKNCITERFSWGLVNIYYEIEGGYISRCSIITDALEVKGFKEFSSTLVGKSIISNEHINSIEYDIDDKKIEHDILGMLPKII